LTSGLNFFILIKRILKGGEEKNKKLSLKGTQGQWREVREKRTQPPLL